MRLLPVFLLPLCALLGAASACSDDGAGEALGSADEPATLQLVSPLGAPACIAVGTQPPAAVPIQVSVNSATLRPEGACGSTTACGHLLLTVDGQENARSAAQVIMFQLSRLASPYHDGSLHQGTGEPDLLAMEIQLLDDAGESWLNEDGEPIRVSFDLAVVAQEDQCPASN